MEAQAQTQTAPQPARPRVMFVDDEEAILTTMRIMFRRTYEVLLAANGEQALSLLRQHDVDVIVSDQRMPGMVGVEVLREARKIRPRAMRILLTGYSDFSAIIGSINDGEIYRFVHKPWSNTDFQEIMAQAVLASQKLTAEQVRELAEAEAETRPARAPAASGGVKERILILDTDTVAVDEVKRMLSAEYDIHHATSIAGALDVLDKNPIGVLLVETMIGSESVSTLLNLLKQHHPQVVAIVLTHRSDANVAIDLINQGQIFRFLLKPVREAMATRSVQQAMQRYHALTQNPVLSQRYQVQTTPAAQAGAVAPSILDRIKNLRKLGSWV